MAMWKEEGKGGRKGEKREVGGEGKKRQSGVCTYKKLGFIDEDALMGSDGAGITCPCSYPLPPPTTTTLCGARELWD